MNLCHNRYGKNAEYMVKCQQRLEFMRICRISVLMSLYQLIPAVKENRKRNCANAKCKIYGQRYFPLS